MKNRRSITIIFLMAIIGAIIHTTAYAESFIELANAAEKEIYPKDIGFTYRRINLYKNQIIDSGKGVGTEKEKSTKTASYIVDMLQKISGCILFNRVNTAHGISKNTYKSALQYEHLIAFSTALSELGGGKSPEDFAATFYEKSIAEDKLRMDGFSQSIKEGKEVDSMYFKVEGYCRTITNEMIDIDGTANIRP